VTRPDRLECPRCGGVVALSGAGRPASVPAPPPGGLCPGCGGPLLARYDLAALRGGLDREAARRRPGGIWRWAELLPDVPPVTLGEGGTPLLPAPRLGAAVGLRRLFIKDEAVNPTGSFKARGMSVAVSVAAAHGARLLAAPSAGNAGGALAAYGARAGIAVRVAMSDGTPPACVAEARRHGARVDLAPGSIADAGRALRETLGPAGPGRWYDVGTFREPFRVEGKKTMGFEIAAQMDFDLPDVIVCPTGGGTGLVGMWKAFEEMEAIGWIGPRRPRMIVVQASGCAPIVRAFEAGSRRAESWPDPRTVAAGLRVPGSLADDLILDAVRASGGVAVAVEDEAIVEAAGRIASLEGIDACPEGGAALAGLGRLLDRRAVDADERIVLFNTGAGLKYRIEGGPS
jgi:threonine synthase